MSNSIDRRILLVEDDRDLARLVALHLSDLGYQVEHIDDGVSASERILGASYDLVILDIMLPGQSGLSICEAMRARGINSPILFLTARAEQSDKIDGLEAGADDYLAKPFCINELAARVRALLRRRQWNESTTKSKFAFKDLEIDLLRQHVERAGKPIALTGIEFRLLSFLAQNADRAVSREELLREVWGYQSSTYDQTVNSHVNRLRSKIEQDPASPEVIVTVWGSGYRFGEPSDNRI